VEFDEVVRRRRMVRNYTDEPVEQASLDRIMRAAVRAPSAGFSQGQRFIVITDPGMRMAVAEAGGEAEYIASGFEPWISQAPVHIVICTEKGAYLRRYSEPDKAAAATGQNEESGWVVPYWWVDAGASMMAILYAAVNEGLAAGFLGAHALSDLKTVLEIPHEIDIVGIATIGHPGEDHRSGSLTRGWNPPSDVVMTNHWTPSRVARP